MNKLFHTLCLSLFLVAVACVRVNAQENIAIKNFHAVANAGAAEVFVKMGATESFKMVGSDEDLDRIETVVQNGILKIRIKRDFNNWNVALNSVKVYITAVKLDALMQSGSGSIVLDGKMASASADIQLSGSGSISAAMDTQSAKVSLSGSGGITLAGKVGDLNITMAGSGDVKADELIAENSKIKIAGNGTAYVQVTESIDAKLVGQGAVKYLGDPTISTSKLGSGSVSRM